MDWLVEFYRSNQYLFEYTLRLVLSLVAGAAIGIERERKNRAAGLRTHTLIAIGSSMLMIVSLSMANGNVADSANAALAIGRVGDPGRIAAQVVSGIGFIGAGTIMRFGGNVRGLTTAASIWIVAALGLTIGGGLYLIAVVGTLLSLFTLTVLSVVERRMFPDRSIKTLEVNVRDTKISTDTILEILDEHGIEVSNVDVTQALKKKTVKMRFVVKIAEDADLTALYKELNDIDKVYQVKLEQPV